MELLHRHGYTKENLPSADAVHRYLKEQGFIAVKMPRAKLPEGRPPEKIIDPHDLWEMDAQGAVNVKGVGYISMINIKDGKSKTYIMSFPVLIKGKKGQPGTEHYLWALRSGFEQFGIPKAIQVDRDSVFIDSSSRSPFPSQLSLFLVGLGIELCFINVRPPAKQAMVERSHQTLYHQVLKGKQYGDWRELFDNTEHRRSVLNEEYPSRSLGGLAPLQVSPEAKRIVRPYIIGQENGLPSLLRVERYLAKCKWFRKVSSNKTVSLNAKAYYLKNAKPNTSLVITFSVDGKKLVFNDGNGLVVQEIPTKDFAKNLVCEKTNRQLIAMKKKIYHGKFFPLP